MIRNEFLLVIPITFLWFAEAAARWRLLRYSPLPIRLAYCFLLLSRKRQIENIVINQRVIRAGFRSERELFEHYSKISGKSVSEVYRRFGTSRLFGKKYHSGGHGVMDRAQKMHLGLVGKPRQELMALSTDEDGFRRTGWEKQCSEINDKDKVCLVLGGSVAFGLGASSDSESIGGRLGHYLKAADSNFVVINHGMLGFSSYQELLTLLQFMGRIDYVVALSGFNELIQFSQDDLVPKNARQLERNADEYIMLFIRSIGRLIAGRSALLAELRRLMVAFCEYDQERWKTDDPDPDVNIYAMR